MESFATELPFKLLPARLGQLPGTLSLLVGTPGKAHLLSKYFDGRVAHTELQMIEINLKVETDSGKSENVSPRCDREILGLGLPEVCDSILRSTDSLRLLSKRFVVLDPDRLGFTGSNSM